MEKAEYKRFLIVSTNQKGGASVIFGTDNEEQAADIYLLALKSYEEEIKSGALSVDLYKIY